MDNVRTLIVVLLVRRTLKLVIDPAIFTDSHEVFDEELAIGIWCVEVVLANQLRARAAGLPCPRLIDDEDVEITVTPVTACIECCERLVGSFLLYEDRGLSGQSLGFVLSGMF